MKLPSLTAFIPCRNEEANVERTALGLLDACRAVADDVELIIVDDASTDRTGAIAERLAREHPEIRVVRNTVSRGYGAALRRGFASATREWVFYTDGDGQFDPAELPALVSLLDRYDIVSAFRLNRCESLRRRLSGRAWTALCNLLLGMRLKDIDCAFKIYPRRLFDEIRLHSDGALIDAEVLAKAARRGYRIGQIGVHHYPRAAGRASGGSLRVAVKAFLELFRLRRDIVAEVSRCRRPDVERS